MKNDVIPTRFINHYNFDSSKSRNFEKPQSSPSRTVPDQSMTVRSMIDRMSRGLPLTVSQKQAVYYDDADIPEVEKMDFAEKRALMEYMQKNNDALRDLFNESEKKRLASEKAAEADAKKKHIEEVRDALKDDS